MFLDAVSYSNLANGVRSIVDTVSEASELSIPLPVIGELRCGFLKGSRAEQNEQTLQKFLAQPQVTIVMPTVRTTELFAELRLHSFKKHKILSHNDIWIAALTKEEDGTLVTYDHDFSVFEDIFGQKLIILDTDH